MPRRVPVWQREGVYYYTDAGGRRVSLRTKDRAEALRRYQAAMKAPKERAQPKPSGDARPPRLTPEAAAPVPPSPPPPAPPPPAAPTQQGGETESHRAHTPDVPGATPGPATNGRPDPLHSVGATAAAPSPPPPGAGPPGEGSPLSDAEVEAAAREMARTVASVLGSLTAALAEARNGKVGIVRQTTFDRSVDNWMAITRRWAREWQMGPWTAITLSTFAVAREQWTCEAGDDKSGPAPPPGVPVHSTAAA